MEENKYILPENTEVKKVMKELWIGKDNLGYSTKDAAICSLAIDRKCNKCGKPVGNNYCLYCPRCEAEINSERYYALEEVEWDGKTPLCLYGTDTYFFDEDEINCYLDGKEELSIKDLQLVLCEEDKPRPFSLYDMLDDIIPEGVNIYDYEGAEKLEAKVNEWLDSHTFSWIASNKRVNYPQA